MKKDQLIVFIILLIYFENLGFSQTYIPGNTYYDSTGYVEYRAGNLPIIISAPHGGVLEPNSIPDRVCNGCATVRDAWTKPISEGVYDQIFEETGCYPHIIINLLHRKKFDANRDIADAADGNPVVEQAWYSYHAFIDSAKKQVVLDYGRGLFLDMHGHGHTIQRIELGYLLSRLELQLSDSILNTPQYIMESSIRTLETDNIQNLSHSELLRGQNSFGTLLADKGFPAVPSFSDPFPQDTEPYFSGGYNTVRHGSRDNGGEIDAIQIEMNQDIRFNDSTRLILIDSLAKAAIEYYDLHYNNQFIGNFCNLILETNDIGRGQSNMILYPNPASDYFIIDSNLDLLEVDIYSACGQKVLYKKVATNDKISLNDLENGLYIIQVRHKENLIDSKKLIVK